jgi:hypothetical protein
MADAAEPPLPEGWTKQWSNSWKKHYWYMLCEDVPLFPLSSASIFAPVFVARLHARAYTLSISTGGGCCHSDICERWWCLGSIRRQENKAGSTRGSMEALPALVAAVRLRRSTRSPSKSSWRETSERGQSRAKKVCQMPTPSTRLCGRFFTTLFVAIATL